MPKVELEVTMMTDNGHSHFSYEDHGALALHFWLLVLFSALFGTVIYSYIQYYKEFDRWDSPHFVIGLTLFF